MTASKATSLSPAEKAEIIANWLTEKKAEDLLMLQHEEENAPAETSIIVTATSIRHGQGLADFVLAQCRKEGFDFLQMEGFAVGMWILLDVNDVVVHIFQQDTRLLYNLDDLWANASVMLDARKKLD